MKLILCSLLTGFIGLTACTKTDTDSDAITPDSGKPQPRYVTGLARDSQGKPLAGADITLSSTYYNAWASAKTGVNGRYRINMNDAPGSGSSYVRGVVKTRYNGEVYTLGLYTEDDDTFGAEGS